MSLERIHKLITDPCLGAIALAGRNAEAFEVLPKLLAVAEAAKGIRHYDHCAYGMGDCPCTCDVGPIEVALDALESP